MMNINLTTDMEMVKRMINDAAKEKELKNTDLLWAVIDALIQQEDKIYKERKDNFEYNARACRHIGNCLTTALHRKIITDEIPMFDALEKIFTIIFNAVPSAWKPMVAPIIDEIMKLKKEVAL